MSTKEKIKRCKEHWICLDVEALYWILMLVYEACTEWTEFIYETNTIEDHGKIENVKVRELYDIAIEKVKEVLAEKAKTERILKVIPEKTTGYKI